MVKFFSVHDNFKKEPLRDSNGAGIKRLFLLGSKLVSCHTTDFPTTNDMTDTNKLQQILTQNLRLNKARLTCLALMVLAVIQCQSANLKK